MHTKEFVDVLEKACFDEWHKFGEQLFQKAFSLVQAFPNASDDEIVKKLSNEIDDAITADELSNDIPSQYLQLK